MTSQDFIELMADAFELDPRNVHETTEIAELIEWDSMAILAFLAVSDKKVGVSPPPEEVVGAKTFGDLLSVVSEGLSDR